ncbi:hypothetical protein COR50_18820 [Chitinophaga caeni]|uniref:Uncharacterized protein n=1 Tax=Chitinophaga caeni TaxID=2029983 RepID=A0A291QYN7_9BACT|nr:hypothetical protein [Chitinophaga caeni]ATL49058.1 hypothetical protein COR50_18820 [Chitinophaga caeni]
MITEKNNHPTHMIHPDEQSVIMAWHIFRTAHLFGTQQPELWELPEQPFTEMTLAQLVQEIKSLEHGINNALKTLPLLKQRDLPSDTLKAYILVLQKIYGEAFRALLQKKPPALS